MLTFFALSCRGRREDRVPIAPMVRVQQEARGRTTGTAETTGLPCAMALRLIRALLGTGVLAPVFATMLRIIASATMLGTARGISTGMPGPHDFAVRIVSFVRVIEHAATRRAHRIPRSRP